jgi:hypothetical protein
LSRDVRPVGGGDNDDALVGGEAVHLHVQLVQRLLALFVAQRLAAARAADGIELVDEHNARAVSAGVLEQFPHTRRADAGEHLDEVRAAGEQEWDAGLAGNRPGEQRLTGARRTDEQDAFRDAAAQCRKARGLPQEVDDLPDLGLRLVDARHVREGDLLPAAIGLAGLPFHRRQAAAAEPVDCKPDHAHDGNGHQKCRCADSRAS